MTKKEIKIKRFIIIFDNGIYWEFHSSYSSMELAKEKLGELRKTGARWQVVEIRPFSDKLKKYKDTNSYKSNKSKD